MSKADCLDIVRLLSALESWGFATNTRLPDYLHDDLCSTVKRLCAAILGETSELSAGLGLVAGAHGLTTHTKPTAQRWAPSLSLRSGRKGDR